MMQNKNLPVNGEKIPLVCSKCNNVFLGPNPRGFLTPEYSFNKKKIKCPQCGSNKVKPFPWIYFKDLSIS